MSQTAIVARDYRIHYQLVPVGKEVRVEVTLSFDVYNYSASTQKCHPGSRLIFTTGQT